MLETVPKKDGIPDPNTLKVSNQPGNSGEHVALEQLKGRKVGDMGFRLVSILHGGLSQVYKSLVMVICCSYRTSCRKQTHPHIPLLRLQPRHHTMQVSLIHHIHILVRIRHCRMSYLCRILVTSESRLLTYTGKDRMARSSGSGIHCYVDTGRRLCAITVCR